MSNTVYNKVTINGTSYIDLSQDTVSEASHIRQGYVGHLNDGTTVTGTYSGGSPSLQAKTNISPSTSSQTITPDQGYDGLSSVQINAMPTGSAVVTATKGTVSNHSVQVTPNANVPTAGYFASGNYPGTAVTVSASELVSGNKEITANGTNIDVADYSTVSVAVPSGSSKNFQYVAARYEVNVGSYTATNLSITVSKAGTYKCYWTMDRNTTSGTSGSQLYNGETALGSAHNTWSNTNNTRIQGCEETLTFAANATITVRARSRNTSYYCGVSNFFIVEQ